MTFKKRRSRFKSVRLQAIRNLKRHKDQSLNKNSVTSPPVELSQENISEEVNSEIIVIDNPCGRRIVDIEFFFKEIQSLNNHAPFDCNISHMDIIKETREGLISHFLLKCKMCNIQKTLYTEDPSNKCNMDINSAAVLATISTGRGYAEMIQEQAILNIPQVSNRQYQKYHEVISKTIFESMWSTIEEAGKEELELAQQVGDVDADGNGLITVIADGAWSKRSYKVNYDALSGVACIVGAKTGKILFLASRNKYCVICSRGKTCGNVIAPHTCSKNWTASSTSMETDIIVEGFKKSVEMHKLKYVQLVGDGDSSVYKKLCIVKPYGYQRLVKKIECSNHLLRNYCTKLRELTKRRTSSRNRTVSVEMRKILFNSIQRLRVGIKTAVNHHRKQESLAISTQVEKLMKDIKNCPFHVFGDHKNCDEYFCKGSKNGEKNYVPDMTENGLMDDILCCGNRLIQNAHSLLLNMNNNAAETYNSIVAKFVGGKRINFSLKNSYDTRCRAAVLSYNLRESYYDVIHRKITSKSPGKYTQEYIKKMWRLREYRKSRKMLFPSLKKRKPIAPADNDYGVQELQISDFVLSEESKQLFLLSLSKSPKEIEEIERSTRDQAENSMWMKERSFRLTSSNFGMVCKKRKTTNSENMAKRILNDGYINSPAIRWGKDNECRAKLDFEEKYEFKVENCGLFIHSDFGYLSASPDGIIDRETIVEVKCPYSASKLTPQDAIEKRKINYMLLKNGKYTLKHFFF